MLNTVNETICRTRTWARNLCKSAGVSVFLALAVAALPATAAQMRFASPEAAVSALFEAVKSDDQSALLAIFGPDGSKLIRSGDSVADESSREKFIQAYGEGNKIVREADKRAELLIGKDGWAMPIPLVKLHDGRWRFDTRAGAEEVLARRIGRNELAAIEVCLAIVDAEREFAARDSDGDGLREYAARFRSSPGKRDGLYWPTKERELLSPLGPLLAAAAKDGYTRLNSKVLQPYHGYFYKLLTKQGRSAPGGAYSYFVDGQMVGGFALIAYPARYGASGIMSFIVNQDGLVFEKNLGKNTAAIAAKVTTFNPDPTWKRPQGPVKLVE